MRLRCVTAAIFWMKTRGRRREMPRYHEIAVRNVRRMTDEELEARIRDLDAEVRPMLS